VDVNISEKVRAGINISGSLTKNSEPNMSNYGATMLVRDMIRRSPLSLVEGVMSSDGYFSIGSAKFGSLSRGDAVTALAYEGGMDNQKIYRATPSIYFEYEPIENLIFRSTGSVFLTNDRETRFSSPYIVTDGETLYPRNGNGELREYYNASTTTLIETTANYTKQIGKSSISALVGFSDQTFESDYLEGRNKGYPNDALTKLDAGALDPVVYGRGAEWALRSAFGRLGYTYDDKYLAEINFRYDGSSRFGIENRYGAFPSFSLGWRMNREGFMQDIDFIDNLKLRMNWGQLGNQNIGNYRHVSTIALDKAYIFNNNLVAGAASTSLSNPDIKWETSTTTDIGIDAGLFDNSLSVVADYYVKVTDNILLTPPVPLTLGNLSPPAQNQGSVENRGWELAVNYFGDIKSDFKYSVSFNWGHNDNKVLKLDKEFISANKVITREGLPISSFYGHRILGIFESDEQAQNNAVYGVQPGGANHAGGDFIFADELTVDTDGDGIPDATDGIINANDKVVIGNTNIRNTFGGTVTMNYKGFDFRAMVQGVLGRDIEDGVYGTDGLRWGANLVSRFLDRWTPDNTDTNVPRVAAGVKYNNSLYVGPSLSIAVLDGSYLRFKQIEFGYTLPKSVVNRAGFSKVRLYVSGQNLFTFTNFADGYDPEDAVTFNNVNDSYPQAKTIAVGVNLEF
ncbi:SusC/RagA family TonB-linked outer membrane protein, partial [Candidatus Pacearchaeota archaeon]|nr:SusC/RagA family TonB-linked outer membrane protein [Candidatus Pacearchaeota archaeon]